MRQPTLKQLFSLAGLAFLLSAVSFGFNFLNFSGAEQTPETQILDTGWSTCTVTAGTQTCGLAGTFHRTFPKGPNVTLAFLSDPFSAFAITIPHTLDIIATGTLTDTWPTMPNAITEIFGNTKNRFFFGAVSNDFVSTQLVFTVNVATAGSANAKLEVQLTPDDTNWFDVASPAGSCDLSISNVGLQIASCPLVSPGTLATYFHGRIAGSGGNGVASPSFGLITVEFEAVIELSSQFSSLSVSTTGFTDTVIAPVVAQSNSAYTISWTALGCGNGGKQC